MLAILSTYSELTHNLNSFYPIILFALSLGSSLALPSIGQLPSQRLRRHYRLAKLGSSGSEAWNCLCPPVFAFLGVAAFNGLCVSFLSRNFAQLYRLYLQ